MRYALIILFLHTSVMSMAIADTTLRWRGEPLSIQIPVGVERVIRFDAKKMQVGIPRDLIKRLAGVPREDLVQAIPRLQDFLRVNVDI